MAFLDSKWLYSDGARMPTWFATSRRVIWDSPFSRASAQAASRISSRVASRRLVCRSRVGVPNMIRMMLSEFHACQEPVTDWIERYCNQFIFVLVLWRVLGIDSQLSLASAPHAGRADPGCGPCCGCPAVWRARLGRHQHAERRQGRRRLNGDRLRRLRLQG